MSWFLGAQDSLVRNLRPLTVCAAAVALAGCTTTMSGGPATAGKPGIRYSLPAPHIYLNPQSDGTVIVEEKYLPDPNRTYTLNLDSYLSTATFDVKLVDGMLTTVSLDSDSSAVAVDAVGAATELQKQRMAADEKRKTEAKQGSDATDTERKTAAEAVHKQKEKIALLKGKRDFYLAHPGSQTPAAMLELDLEISQEEIQLSQLEARLGIAKSGSSSNEPRNSFSDPGAVAKDLKLAYGPVFFRVLATADGGVKLISVESQRTFQTSASSVADKAPDPTPKLRFIPDLVTIRTSDAKREINFKSSQALDRLDLARSRLAEPSKGVSAVTIPGNELAVAITDSEGKTLKLDLPANLPKGVYRLDLAVQAKGSTNTEVQHVTIHWLMD